MKNRNEERVIYLKDLIFVVLYQWKKLLIGAVVLAVVLGGFQGITGLIDLKSPEKLEAITKQNQIQTERYEAEVESLKKQIETLRNQVRSQQEYLDNSLLMQLQPYDFYEASLVIYVDTDYQILPEMAYQNINPAHAIMKAYESLLLGNDCLQAMADAMDSEPRYLKELISISCNYESGTSNANMMHITAKATDEAQAQQLLDLLIQQLGVQQKNIFSSVGSHSYRIVEQATRKAFSQALADQQKAENERLATLLSEQTTVQSNQAALTPPSLQSDSGKAVLKKTIIFAVIGAVAAVFLGVVILWIGHITSPKVYSCRTLDNRTDAKCLGAMPTGSGDRIYNRLQALEGRVQIQPEEQAAILAALIRSLSKDTTHLLVTGDVSAEDRTVLLEAISKAMPGVQVSSTDDILKSAAALNTLAQCDTVLLVEQCKLSTYRDINRRIEWISDQGKQLLGCVVYGG